MNRMRERVRFNKGLYAWMGFRSRRRAVPCAAAPGGGGSRWRPRQLLRFALDGMASFTTIPLRVWSYLGLLISLFAFCYAMVFLVKTLMFGTDVPGFPTLDHLGDVLRRRAAHLARRDRRVPRAHVRGGEGPAAVPGGRGAGHRAAAAPATRRRRAARARGQSAVAQAPAHSREHDHSVRRRLRADTKASRAPSASWPRPGACRRPACW